jgi:hypothetical protein
MGPITSIIPTPRTVPCGGRSVKVSEFRLRDLAFLQSVLDGMEPDPIAAIEEELSTATGARRKDLIFSAWDRAEAGPPVYGSESGRAFFSTPPGGSLVLWVALRREHPAIDPAEAARLYMAATAAEIGLVWRVAHGISPARAMERIAFPPEPPSPPSGAIGPTWPEMVDEVAVSHGWTYEQIFDLTISQWHAARNGGKPAEIGRYVPPGGD